MHKSIYLLYLVIQHVFGQAPIVRTTQGLVMGIIDEQGDISDDFYMYLGIPYGVVDPKNPFGAALPHPPFEGVFYASNDQAICPQVEEFNNSLAGSFDCLQLSVHVPRANNDTPKAVLVWIYGGRFEIGFFGNFLYGARYLVRHDIILVTLNYRLGPFGFMCTDHSRVPGNQGLKDQLMALRWIKENIANFGGDPNKITIDGNSAGSMSVDLHIVSNHEPKLFNQAILQSGTSLTPFALPDRNAPLKLSRHFGLETDDISTALDFLAPIDPLDIIEASLALGFTFRPCIEQTFEGVEAFISHNWVRNDTLPLAKDMNIMIGFNDDEGLVGLLNTNISEVDIVTRSLATIFDVDHEEFSSEQVRHFFFGDDELNNDVIYEAAHLSADMSFVYPSFRSLDRFLKNDARKIYLYKFTYDGERNFVKRRINVTRGGAFHADEYGYLFDISYMEAPNVEDQLVMDRMTEMWANFVKYGDPTPQTSSILPQKWEAITRSSPYHFMDIGLQLTPGTRPWHERITFWDLFFETYGHMQRFMLLEDGGRVRNDVDKRNYGDILSYKSIRPRLHIHGQSVPSFYFRNWHR